MRGWLEHFGKAAVGYSRGVREFVHGSQQLASSAGRGWSSIAVETRANGVGEVWGIVPKSVEIVLVVAGNTNGLVRRNVGVWQTVSPRTGSLWLSPAGLKKDIVITSPIPETAHLYLPTTLFDSLKDDFAMPTHPAQSIRNEAGIADQVIDALGRSIVAELATESAASSLYVDFASLTLAARLLQRYCDSGAARSLETSGRPLDDLRLRRVLDYIAANIRNDIGLQDLAGVAGYSLFHFARKFTQSVGVAPHRYISQARMNVAMEELLAGELSIAEIALNAHFSSQASFPRAFHRATGLTPLEYRRRGR